MWQKIENKKDTFWSAKSEKFTKLDHCVELSLRRVSQITLVQENAVYTRLLKSIVLYYVDNKKFKWLKIMNI